MANTLDNVLVEHHKLGVIKFKEFLNIEPKKLSKKEYTLQKVMARLYHLNERIPPLFYTFPERPNKPLVIKADTINRCSSNNIGALYDSDDNYIQFENTGSGDNYLLNELAHELKHAEQYSEERRNLFKEKNGLICHQIDYLDEAQAYAFGDYVVALDCLEKKCSADEYIEHACSPYLIPYYKKALKEGKLDREQFEQNGILTTLHVLYSSSFDLHYRAKFDERNIINDNDSDIDHIPASFHLSKDFIDKKLLKELKKAPHKASTLPTRLLQLLSNRHEIAAKFLLFFHIFNRKSIVNSSLLILSDMYLSNNKLISTGNLLFSKLIKFGADVNVRDEEGYTPLMCAVGKKNTELVGNLLAAGADVNAKDIDGDTVLIYTAESGNTELLEKLINAKADLTIEDYMGKTALTHAAINGNIEAIEKLLAAGADVNAKNIDGKTTLMLATEKGNSEEAIEKLIEAGANIDTTDKRGYTALMYAVKNGKVKSIEKLLAAGADVYAKNKDGYTALMYADKNNIIKKLIEATINMREKNKKNSINIAQKYKKANVNISQQQRTLVNKTGQIR